MTDNDLFSMTDDELQKIINAKNDYPVGTWAMAEAILKWRMLP